MILDENNLKQALKLTHFRSDLVALTATYYIICNKNNMKWFYVSHITLSH